MWLLGCELSHDLILLAAVLLGMLLGRSAGRSGLLPVMCQPHTQGVRVTVKLLNTLMFRVLDDFLSAVYGI